jgi:ribosome-associated protein
MPAHFAEAVFAARKITSHSAKRRQLQYIGRILREIDVEPIQKALGKVQKTDHETNARFRQVEEWRDKLIAQGDLVLQEFFNLPKTTEVDIQHLRQLMRRAQQDVKAEKNRGAVKLLFRYLRSVMVDPHN